jgi:hypothetical protein
VIGLGLDEQLVKDVAPEEEDPRLKRFLVLQRWYQASENNTPEDLAGGIVKLCDVSAENIKKSLDNLPLGLTFPLQPKLITAARDVPVDKWNILTEKAPLAEAEKQAITDRFGEGLLMGIVLVHSVAQEDFPGWLARGKIARKTKHEIFKAVGIQRGMFYRFVERPLPTFLPGLPSKYSMTSIAVVAVLVIIGKISGMYIMIKASF